MKKLLGIVLFFAISPALTAQPNLVWCNNCTDAQMQEAAIRTPAGNITYVGDLIEQKVNAYQVYFDVEDTNPTTRKKIADQISPDQNLVKAVTQIISYYSASPVGLAKKIPVYTNRPTANQVYVEDPNVSVYNVVNAGRSQNIFNAWLNSGVSPTVDAKIELMTLAAQASLSFNNVSASIGPSLTVDVFFKDGSYVAAIFDKIANGIRVDPSTAVDSQGNPVGYLGSDGSIHNLGGVFNFSGTGGSDNLQNFLNQLAMMGVPITDGSSQQHGWACTRVGDGEYVCQRF
ncbi:MAG: hypothetical protein JSR27_12525 [Proteobacteria bacterium]|nr:hypothetical protein [Pseudomonadota bacterium]